MSHAAKARRLLRAHRYGALSTLSQKLGGFPFGSITPYLTDHDGSLLILISALAEHSKNIRHDSRVSLITHNQSDPAIQMQGRVTVAGHARRIEASPSLLARYLRHFPEATDLLNLDFSFHQIQPLAIRYIGGVGRVHWLNMEHYRTPHADYLAQHEAEIINKINEQQYPALRNLLLRHAMPTEQTRLIGVDDDGFSLSDGRQYWRLDFAQPLTTPDALHEFARLSYQNA